MLFSLPPSPARQLTLPTGLSSGSWARDVGATAPLQFTTLTTQNTDPPAQKNGEVRATKLHTRTRIDLLPTPPGLSATQRQ